MVVDSEAAYPRDEKTTSNSFGREATQPLAPTKSRSSYKGGPHTLDNKPDDVDAAIWMEEVSVVGVQERKLSWYQAAALLLTEYVVLAILAFPYSYQVLGYAGATLSILFVGLSTYYTSYILWKFCMRHPQIRDIADAAEVLTVLRNSFVPFTLELIWMSVITWFIMGLHVVAGATAIQTIRGGTESTLVWAIAIAVIMWFFSNLRSFSQMSTVGLLASSTMFIATLLVIIGHGVQGLPNGYKPNVPITHSVWAPEGTTFVQGVNALLNVVYTFIGHALIPSFVGDMEQPRDFPKALAVSMAAEFILFTLTGAIVYHYTGTEYATAPAYGSLRVRFGKVAAGFVLPTIIIVGILYSLVTSRAIFFQIFREGSPHRTGHTVKGWSVWLAIVFGGWVISFIIGEAIPFFSDMLSLISSLFDSWFGYIMWACAWWQMSHGQRGGIRGISETILNALILITGFFFFGAGTYASVQSIIDSYAAGAVKTPFTRANTGFVLEH
ncbi:uncharacterized protein JCM15063_003652 [Sporobolomyces koalae]|uniref:uncharacterized protein n=1 Tax=Sporobolomyces koalae TaxID=500713 RepID=UPI0031721371